MSFAIARALYVLLLFSSFFADVLPIASGLNLLPSKVMFQSVYQSYEDTLFRKMFSSVPRREFALNDFSLELESGDLVVVLGASSSGKSTILRLLRGTEEPVRGEILVQSTSTPIYLDSAPQISNRHTIQSHLEDSGGVEIVRDFCKVADLEMSKSVSDLTKSELYKLALVEACLRSVGRQGSSCPILLLDEWLDREAPFVVQKVEETMMKLTTSGGAILLYVTHKPKFMRFSHKTITMCRGAIL